MSAAEAKGFRTAGDVPAELREDLSAVLLSLADNKRLLGMRYAEWLLGAPTLEAGIACSAMAQDEWGHSRIFYAMLKDFELDPGHLEHEREAGEYLNIELLDEPPPEWTGLVALNFLLDSALAVQFESLRDSRFEPLHYKVRKVLEEERFHYEHGRGWLARISETEAGRAALAAAFAPAWNSCLRWFGAPDGELIGRLADAGVCDADSNELRARWLARVGPVVHDAGLDLAARGADGTWRSNSGPDWSDWDGARRRSRGGGPNPGTLAAVRGDKNRTMLMD
ncbi:MAG: Phenylacetic acid catabolic protein [Candidatus Palauibacterales bacterium]|nr:Phenylacetic acid catabolic protein [Candidatus Palauibacterales bacterium]MDP2483521.1 Phenylacetic acid catabolic protein [Candidatus Palauibacterales bacterium]